MHHQIRVAYEITCHSRASLLVMRHHCITTILKVNNVSKNIMTACDAMMQPLLDVNVAFWIIFSKESKSSLTIVKCNVLDTTPVSLCCRMMWCSTVVCNTSNQLN